MNDWINKRSRIYWYDQYVLNEQATAFAKYDPNRIVGELLDTGADVIVVYAANQYGVAYYPSEVAPQHPNLGGRDYVGDLISRLREHDKKVVLYLNWLSSMHPKWRYRSPDQQLDSDFALASWATDQYPVLALKGGTWHTSCLNSPRRDQIKAQVREICERYRPDALHLDMFFNTDICVCEFCRPGLERICSTTDLTREVIEAHWPAYMDWRCESTTTLMAQLHDILREFDVLAAHNAFAPLYHEAITGLNRGWMEHLDVYVSECFDAFNAAWADLNATSLTVRWQHAVGMPAWILRTSHQMQYAHWPISKAQWEIYAAACKANGCKVFGPCGVGARPDTTTAPSLLEHVKHGLDFYMQDADLDDGAESAAKIALVFSWATRRYCPPPTQETHLWAASLIGWGRLLIEEHLPFDVVIAEDANLDSYDLVILPNADCLSDAFCRALNEFKGCVIADGRSSMRDENGADHADFALGDLLGVTHVESINDAMAIEMDGDAGPVYGVLQRVRCKDTGQVMIHGVDVDTAGSVSFPWKHDPLPLERSQWPICVGRERTRYVAFAAGEFYSRHGDEHIGQLMAGLIDDLLPERQITLNAPRTLEVTLWARGDSELIVHLANRTVPWTLATKQRQPTEIIALHDVKLRVLVSFDVAKVTARHAEIDWHIENGELVITVARIHAYAAIVIEGSGE